MYRAACKMTPGHKHSSKEVRGENVITFDTKIILYNITKNRGKKKTQVYNRIYIISLQFKFFAILFSMNNSNSEESAPQYSAI
jgi:hypothetical protein